MKTIIKQVEKMAAEAPDTKPLCWFEIGYKDRHANYCPECAEKIMAWLTKGGEQPEFDAYEEYPTWAAIDQVDERWLDLWQPGPSEYRNYIRNSYRSGYEADGAESCEHCGCSLSTP